MHRLLFTVRSAVRRLGLDAGRWLGSWRLSVVTMVALAFYQALLAVWATSTPAHVVGNIARLSIFHLVYVLILLNIVVCFWRRLGQFPKNPGSFLFHGSFLLVALGFLLSFTSRQEARLQVAAGETFAAVFSPLGSPRGDTAEQILSQSPPRILSLGMPRMEFTVEEVTPEFWQDQLLFTRLEAVLTQPDGRRRTTRINWPRLWDPITTIRLSGFGYTPRWELRDRQAKVLDSAFVKLNVFPPGQRDFFHLPNLPHRFYVEVLPDLARAEDGEPYTRTFNLANPAVRLQVWRGRVDLGGGLIESGQGFEFEGLILGFPEIRPWGEFTVVRDPGMPLLFLGYAVGLLGLLMKLLRRPA
jgi:hypothetical protein